MKHFVTSLFTFIILIIFGFNVFAQSQDARFFMETDRTSVAEGETFVLNIVMENIDGKNIELPDLSAFRVVQGPSTSSSITIINGKRTGTMSYQYLLLATKIGKYTIGSAKVRVSNKILKSNTIAVEVTNVAKHATTLSTSSKGSETFVRLEANHVEKAYLGQQLVLNLILYTRKNIESFQLLNEPSFDGFYAQAVHDIRDQPKPINIKGKEYVTQVVRRWILFPQKTGKYSLGPVNCNLDIIKDNGQTSFFFTETTQETLVSNSIKFNIQNLPLPSPKSFTGAVGNYTMEAQIKNPTVEVGEGVTINMQIEGDGDSRIVQAPSFDIPISLERYSPAIIKDETYPSGSNIKMKKEFQFVFVPSLDTVLTLLPEFTYFDVSSSTYKTLKASPFTINVVKESQKASNNGLNTLGETTQAQPSPDLNLVNMKGGFYGSKWYWLAFCGILTAFLIVAFRQNISTLWPFKDQISNKENNLSDTLKRKLVTIKTHSQTDNSINFYDELSDLMTKSVKQKYNIADDNIDIEGIAHKLRDQNMSEALILEYIELQNKCSLARFAGVHLNMTEIYHRSEKWLISAGLLNK